MRNVVAVAFSLVACGGQVVVGDAGATDAGGSDAPLDAGGDAAPDCNSLGAQITALESQARTCCPICNTPQCGFAVQSVCCPISMTASDAPALTQAVAQYKQLGCRTIACAGAPCRVAPSKTCVPTGPGNSQSGICQ